MGEELRREVILLVGDDAASPSLVRFLHVTGFATSRATNAEGALAETRRRRPSLVLMDVHLPDVSGYELCHVLREEFGSALPIVFVSADRTEPDDRVAGLLIGADDYIVAPFDCGELLARLRRLLSRSAAVEPNGAADLTLREREVLTLLAQGRDQAGIASDLVISPKTVASHIQHILVKLGAHSRAEAVALAHRGRLLDGRP